MMKSAKHLRLLFVVMALSAFTQVHAQKTLADSIITKELLQQYVQTLAHDRMQGRYTGTAGCEKAAAWIAGEMKNIGLKILDGSDSNYYHLYKIERQKGTISAANIVGKIPGKKADGYIIFSAHYDHVGDANEQKLPTQFENGSKDKLFNGANDNASGVAAMLALAKYYAQQKNNDHTILFIAFSGEENGLLGSKAFVQSFTRINKIKQVINLEMLGRISAKNKKPFVTEGLNSYGFLKKLNGGLRSMNGNYKNNFFQHDWRSGEDYFMRSDNYSFAEAGVPANTIMATNGFDKYYHTASDEWQTLNYDDMENIVRAIALACTPFLYHAK